MGWNRIHYMTVGLLLVFVGFHFRVVETFVLTPQATKFLQEQSDGMDFGGNAYGQNAYNDYNQQGMFAPTYQQASTYGTPTWQSAGYSQGNAFGYQQQKAITPPTWLGWPMICIGGVLFLFGFTATPNHS